MITTYNTVGHANTKVNILPILWTIWNQYDCCDHEKKSSCPVLPCKQPNGYDFDISHDPISTQTGGFDTRTAQVPIYHLSVKTNLSL